MAPNLKELYREGLGLNAVDPRNDAYLPLFLCIELTIVNHYDEHPALTDGAVMLSLRPLSMDPATPQADELGQRIQQSLADHLSLNHYSEREVKQAIRHIARSVQNHTATEGVTGYLDFIRRFLRK